MSYYNGQTQKEIDQAWEYHEWDNKMFFDDCPQIIDKELVWETLGNTESTKCKSVA